MHDGVKVQIGGLDYVMPKLTAGPLKRHWPKIAELRKRVAAAPGESDLLDVLVEMLDAQIALVHAALKRNYPDLALELLEEELSPVEVRRLFERLVEISHFEQRGAAAGEAERPKS